MSRYQPCTRRYLPCIRRDVLKRYRSRSIFRLVRVCNRSPQVWPVRHFNFKKKEIIVFRAWFLAQIVANCTARRQRLILGLGDDYLWNYGRPKISTTCHTCGDLLFLWKIKTNFKVPLCLRLTIYFTVPMINKNSWMLEHLAFDEYCRFDTSAVFYWIKRGSLYINRKLRFKRPRGRRGKPSNPPARHARAMHGENLRKFTETRARTSRARYALIFCWS